MDKIQENLDEKYPKLGSYFTTFKEVWRETFPDADKKMANRMRERKKIAK